ncbi:Hypothetical protein R9X50_00283200 [Acrodontium crateriforme]|uniref:Ribosomal protein S15 n=1 Tax=Acrodontium crateriforme TaxID=150365 RepID=A0AAQ3M2B0_9PEZI|nr:Hypothetical protein R9X50_00283200 [Acrodontium crateriforme]
MPPRIPLFQCLKAPAGPAAPLTKRPFSSTPTCHTQTPVRPKPRHRDPYTIAQAKARKDANLSRRAELSEARKEALGDPIRGVATEYVKSLDTAQPATTNGDILNFFLDQKELERGIEKSKWLSEVPEGQRATAGILGDISPEEQLRAQQEEEATAAEALRRITSLSLGSSQDRQRVNIQQAIESFGRHNTDKTLSPKPQSAQALANPQQERTPRVGPDTGSSEVQIAILTAKINTLADFIGGRGKMDKVNKRNLRLLVHRRQKLLQYLRRKERGGPRWQHVIETLGLTEGTWKGEISL